jgi:dTDP-4-dehydrorhamnose reductase
MQDWASGRSLRVLVHAAAFTSPPKIDQDPVRALEVNIVGTANVVRLCAALGIRLVYISTDYVFRGDRGRYAEGDEVHPVNKYAWSKLGGECAARLYDKALIIRTTFGPDVFPYEKAFDDQWTSRQPVSRAARDILLAVDSECLGVLHIGGPRRTVLDYARSLDPARTIQPLSVNDVPFAVPRDTSLDTARFVREVAD